MIGVSLHVYNNIIAVKLKFVNSTTVSPGVSITHRHSSFNPCVHVFRMYISVPKCPNHPELIKIDHDVLRFEFEMHVYRFNSI